MSYQTEIISYLKTVDTATLSDIYNNISTSYPHNWAKYTGEIMSRMVANGQVERVKKGVFRIAKKQKKEINQGIFEGVK